ncbi:MAG: cytochrome c oxidase assembly protein [Actinobacteria bacterium]|nr:cytochrome c oxidase assembly protein [Actinomycetota bacterium]
MTVATCVPADPQSKGGSEATVRIAKADLVPTDHNLRPAYADFAEQCLDEGYPGFKIHGFGDPRKDIEICRAVAERVGGEMDLMLDPASEYDTYAETTQAWGLTPLVDQQLAGVTMWVPGGLIYLGIGLALLAAWFRESAATPRPRLDDAAARSVPSREPGHSRRGSGTAADAWSDQTARRRSPARTHATTTETSP